MARRMFCRPSFPASQYFLAFWANHSSVSIMGSAFTVPCPFSLLFKRFGDFARVKSLGAWSPGIALHGDSGMFLEKLGEGYYGKGIGRGTPGFPGLKGAEADRKPAPAQQLGGLGLTYIVLCAPGFEPNHHRRK